MIRVLSAHKGCDTAGIGWLLTQAFKGHPEVTLRSAVRRSNYIGYPHDLDWQQVGTEWAATDVVHLHNSFGTWRLLGAGKPFVLHHHGTFYRKHADVLNDAVAEHGGRAVVSTLDLLDFGDDLTWAPAPFDLEWLAGFRKPHTGRLRVGHSPTDRAVKDTDAFLAACQKLDVEPVLIERRSWADCLALKGTCDVFYDQVRLGYGHAAIEAWGMGIPVIAGADGRTLARMRDTFGTLPFYSATASTIGDAVEALTDEDTRIRYTRRGLAHVARWHDGRETIARLTPIYRQLAG